MCGLKPNNKKAWQGWGWGGGWKIEKIVSGTVTQNKFRRMNTKAVWLPSFFFIYWPDYEKMFQLRFPFGMQISV